MNKLQEILSLCVDKKLSMQVYSSLGLVRVNHYDENHKTTIFSYETYYEEDSNLFGYDDGTTIHIDKLIKKIEEYGKDAL